MDRGTGEARSGGAGLERALLLRALDVLKAGGAEGDAFLEHRRTLHLRVRDGRLEEISRAEVRGVGIRAMREGRLGFAHTTSADLDGVTRAAGRAIELAGFATARDDLALADPAGPGDGSDEGEALRLYDATIEKRTIEEKEARAREAEAAAMAADPRVKRSEGASYDETLGATWLANTRGLFRHARATRINVGVSIVADDQGEMQPGDRDHDSVSWAGLPAPEDLGRRAAERALRLLGGRPVETGRYPIVFSPDAGWTLLIHLTQALNGNHLSRGRSWLAGSEEAAVASALVTIRDDGRLAEGPNSAPFDGEGTDVRDRALVEQGRVRGQMLDLASSRRLGRTSTGNSQRGGYEQLPDIGPHNLYMVPGSSTPERMIAGVDRGLWIWALSGWWIGMDPSNPEFSSAASGLWIENGKPVRPVARVTVAGRLTEILGAIEEIGNDLTWDHGVKTPTFKTGPLAISGV